MGGYKEIVAEIRGRGAFAKLKFESGVHRVQRVPDTEAHGRIHTSTATVAVLPEAEEVDIVINEADLKIDTMRAGGAGGQHVNKTESAIRMTHIPTGIEVKMQEDRSQHRNRAKAMAVLRAQLYDAERQKRDAARAAERRGQVGSGDRSERIRTYNFPQGRVSDHRINLTLYKLPQIIEGEALRRDHRRAGDRAPGRTAGRGRCGVMTELDRDEFTPVVPAQAGTRNHRPLEYGSPLSRGRPETSIRDLRQDLARTFRRHGLDTPELDARILVGHALRLDHAALAAQADRGLTTAEASDIAALAARRLAREPVARIVGTKEFWSLPIGLNADTLVPRPETETVVEAALAALDRGGDRARPLRIADLGTGSGAILLALLTELPAAVGVGTDIDERRARLRARQCRGARSCRAGSVRRLRLRHRARGAGSISWSPIRPTLRATTSRRLHPRCAIFDPRRALDGGPDGLDGYRAIAADARRLLAPDGMLVVELGLGQSAAVSALFAARGCSRPSRRGTIWQGTQGPGGSPCAMKLPQCRHEKKHLDCGSRPTRFRPGIDRDN